MTAVPPVFLSADCYSLLDGRPFIAKSPGSTKDYTVDLSELLPDGVTIASAEVTAQGVTVKHADIVGDGRMIQAWVSGGILGADATVTFQATFSDGETVDERTIWLSIRNTG